MAMTQRMVWKVHTLFASGLVEIHAFFKCAEWSVAIIVYMYAWGCMCVSRR